MVLCVRSLSRSPYLGEVIESIRRRARLTLPGALAVTLALLTGLFGAVFRRVEFVTFSAFLSMLVLTDMLVLLSGALGSRVSLRLTTFPKRVVLGSAGRVVVEAWVKGRGEGRLVIEVRDTIDLRVAEVEGELVNRGRGYVRLEYLVKPIYRGTHVLGPISVTAPSPLGLIVYEYVLPPVTLRSFDAVPTFYAESVRVPPPRARYPLPGGHPVMVKGGVGDFVELREYVPGDDVRFIHWPSSARNVRGVPLVKEMLFESERDVFIAIDPFSVTTFEYSKGRRLIDDIVDAAGSIVHLAQRYGDAVGFFIASSPSLSLPPTRRLDYIYSTLRYLEEVQPTPECRIRWLPDVAGRYVKRGTLVLVLSPLSCLSAKEVKGMVKALKALQVTPIFIIPDTVAYASARVPGEVMPVISDITESEKRRLSEVIRAVIIGGGDFVLARPGTLRTRAIEAFLSMRGAAHAVKR